MIPLVESSNATAEVAKNEFMFSLRRKQPEKHPVIEDMFLSRSMTGRTHTESFFGDTQEPAYWNEGVDEIEFGTMKDYTQVFTHYTFQHAIPWKIKDSLDSRIGKIREKANALADKFIRLKERIADQIVNAVTDSQLLPVISNSYLGLPLISSSHTFVSGGNTMSHFSFSSIDSLQASIYAGFERFQMMMGENGVTPYYDRREVNDINNYRFFVAAGRNTQVWQQTLRSMVMPGGVTQTANVDNLLAKDMTLDFNRILFQSTELTGDDFFMIFVGREDAKPLVHLERTGLETDEFTKEAGSDWSKRTGLEAVSFMERHASGPGEPRTILKLTA